MEYLRQATTPHKTSTRAAHISEHNAMQHERTLTALPSFLSICSNYRQVIVSYSYNVALQNCLHRAAQAPTLPLVVMSQALAFKTLKKTFFSFLTIILSRLRPGLSCSADADACDRQLVATLF